MPDNAPVLTRRPPVLLDQVEFSYPGAATPALREVTLHVAPGELCSVVGASGAGKSTLLRLLNGELRPSAGTAVVAGIDLTTLPPRRLPRLRRRIGVAAQDPDLLPGRDAVANIVYALELTGVPASKARTRATQTLAALGIEHLAGKHPEHMSGGEAQRVAIARALATGPAVLLADEPTGSLDPETTLTVIDTLLAVASTGVAVVMATHDVAAVNRIHGRVIRVEDGTIAADTTGGYTRPTDLTAYPSRRSLREGGHR